jgi:regulatory protein
MTFDGHDDDSEKPAGRRGNRARKDRPPREKRETRPREKREPKPLDTAQLQDLAIGYAARYATTAAKLRRYLMRKLGERGWSGETLPETDALVTRIGLLGYVDDRAYAASKARDLASRGFGARRVRSALAAAGVGRDDVSAAIDPDPDADFEAGENQTITSAITTAITFARRRRFGPFARAGTPADPARERRELAAMARAGHDFGVARRVLTARDEAAALALADDE